MAAAADRPVNDNTDYKKPCAVLGFPARTPLNVKQKLFPGVDFIGERFIQRRDITVTHNGNDYGRVIMKRRVRKNEDDNFDIEIDDKKVSSKAPMYIKMEQISRVNAEGEYVEQTVKLENRGNPFAIKRGEEFITVRSDETIELIAGDRLILSNDVQADVDVLPGNDYAGMANPPFTVYVKTSEAAVVEEAEG